MSINLYHYELERWHINHYEQCGREELTSQSIRYSGTGKSSLGTGTEKMPTALSLVYPNHFVLQRQQHWFLVSRNCEGTPAMAEGLDSGGTFTVAVGLS